MNHVTASLVTDEAPATLIHDDGLVAIRFVSGNAFTVILPQTMTPDQKAAWCIGFAKELTDLAADIQSKTATVTEETKQQCSAQGHIAYSTGEQAQS